METKFIVGDIVYEKNNLPKWRKKRMIIKSISNQGFITCYVFPKFDVCEITEREFADWMLEKASD